MGILYSKPEESELIETIETNVVDLIIRLSEEDGYLDSLLKKHLLAALEYYSRQMDQPCIKKHMSCSKTIKIKDLILLASSKLETLKGQESNLENDVHLESKDINALEEILHKYREQTNSIDEVKNIDHIQFFKTCIFYSKELERKNGQKDDRISTIILEVFLKSPVKKNSDIFQKHVETLDMILDTLEKFNLEDVNIFNRHVILEKLLKMEARVEDLQSLFTKVPVWKKIHEDLVDCETLTQKLVVPIGDDIINRIKNKVEFLLKYPFSTLPEENEKTIQKNQLLSKKATQILSQLKRKEEKNNEIKLKLKRLRDLEIKVLQTVHSDDEFKTKKSNLENFLQELKNTDTLNERLKEKDKILKKIYTFIKLISVNYLDDIKEAVSYFKTYAENFSFPKHLKIYDERKQEILLLKECLKDLPQDFDPQCTKIEHQIDEVLLILREKAIDNQGLVHILNQLEFVEHEMPNVPIEKLKEFNKIRTRINSFPNFDDRMLQKKINIFGQIHQTEKQCFSKHYPPQIDQKLQLIEYEERVLKFKETLDSDAYNQTKNKILHLLKSFNQTNPPNEVMPILEETASTLLILLDNISATNKVKNEHLQYINSVAKGIATLITSKSPTEETLNILHNYEELLSSIERCFKETDVSEEISKVKKQVTLEKFKIQVHKFDTEKFTELTAHINYRENLETFNNNLNRLLSVKEELECLPNEDCGNKTSLLEQVYITLESLDKTVAKLIRSDKKPKRNYELKNHWDAFKMSMTMYDKPERTDVEIFELFTTQIKEIETCVKSFLGTKNTVDYQHISQHLNFVFEELQTLNASGNLKNQFTELENVVKNLNRHFLQ